MTYIPPTQKDAASNLGRFDQLLIATERNTTTQKDVTLARCDFKGLPRDLEFLIGGNY